MGRILNAIFLTITATAMSFGQCPDLPNNTTVDGSTNTSIDMCGASSATFEVNDPNLPSGTIDWYSSTTSGFDPLVSGTFLGSSNIDSADPCDPGGCPSIEVIYIDACGPGDESLNEFMVISSGSGFAVDDLSITFDVANTFGSAGNGNINVGGTCGWSMGELSLLSGCGSLIAVGPGDYIPPNSAVIIQTSNFGTTVYDISTLCGVSDCVYVLRNSCDRNVGAFTNCGGGTSMGSTRTNQIALTCGCNDVLVYDILDPNFLDVCNNIGNNGMHVFADLTYANELCANGPNLGSIQQYIFSATTDPFDHTFTDAECNTTQYVVGVLNSTQFNTDCCTEQQTEEYEFDIACIVAELQGDIDLCPGECGEITVLISGGEPPYDLDLTLTGLPFPFDNIMIPFTGFPVDEKITICFDNGGPLLDNDTYTVDAPAIAAGLSGSLTLIDISDASGCVGTIEGSSVSVSFNDAPSINNPGDQEACDIGDGTAIFVLADLTNTINGGSGATVNYYSDPDGMSPITDPYITSGGPVYAQVMGNPCNSEIIEFNLNVISNGNAGLITFFCSDSDGSPSNECNICDDDGVLGEQINLTIIFEDPSLNYDFEVLWTEESGSSSTIMGTGLGMATVTFAVDETTTFVITSVTASGDCPDMTNLGNIITINYSIPPDIDAPQDLSGCGALTLPDITGSDVPGNAAYFTEMGGMGTMYNPGDMIDMSTTLYLYAGIEDCDVEYEFTITIEEEAIIDDPDDIVTCGVYVLPEITGTNVDNVAYYTEMDGGGNEVAVGTIISNSVVLYLYDATCGGNQPTLDITITPGPVITNNTDTIVCEMYIVEPITGTDLSGNEMYYDTTGGNGMVINVGDTLTQDSIIFIYDNSNGCEIEVPIFIDIKEAAYPGLDTAIVLCAGDPTLIDINDALGGTPPDTTGSWLDVNNTDIIVDSTQVDFSSLLSGTYIFEYRILDSICVDTHSILTVNIIDTPDAGMDATITLCSDTTGVNVFDLMGNPSAGGTFYDEFNMVVNIDPTNADFDASTPGSTVYSYIVGNPASSCGSDSSTFTVVVEDSVDAGMDNTSTFCAGVDVDLTALISGNSAIGSFVETTVSGGLNGTSFDTDAVDDGTYLVYHILDGIGSCPADTAILTLNIVDGANAGDENEITLCGDASISLTDYINGDSGGQFYLNNALLPSGDIDYTTETGTFDYLYIVGDGVECPFDTAILTVTRNIKPGSVLDITLEDLCDDDCTTISFNAANPGGQTINVFYSIASDQGEIDNRQQNIGDLMPNVEVTFCIGNGGLASNEVEAGRQYTFTLDSISVDNPSCVFDDGLSVSFTTYAPAEGTLNGIYCTEDQVVVGNDTYDITMTSGTSIIPNGSISGCDSIVMVNLEFQDVAEGIYMATPCEGESVTVLGTTYTETNTSDEFLLPNASTNGCDSLVIIDIVFVPSTMGQYTETICEGDTITVNGEEFFVGYQSNSQVLLGANAAGCDSIVDVMIDIDESVSSTFTGDFCSTYSITINGRVYDQSYPSGFEVLENQAANGCDSLVMIDLTFNQEAIDSVLALSTCDINFSITIGTTTFDINNTSGNVILEASDATACDTMIDVTLTFGELDVQYLEIDGSCESVDSGYIILEEIAGNPPFNIIYGGNNAIAYTLPLDIRLPIGSGEMSISDANDCETTLMYELFSGEVDFQIDENQGQLSVSGDDMDSIIWSPTDGLSCTDCPKPIANPTQTTTYTATVIYDDSCSIELSIDVFVVDDTPDYVLPSVFSPNEDQINENFILTITKGAIGIPQNMSIYDRWGNLVFVGVGEQLINEGWNGTKDGKDLASGVYVYHLTILEGEKVVSLYGDVTLLR